MAFNPYKPLATDDELDQADPTLAVESVLNKFNKPQPMALPELDLSTPAQAPAPQEQPKSELHRANSPTQENKPAPDPDNDIATILGKLEQAQAKDRKSNSLDRIQAYALLAGSAVSSGMGGLDPVKVQVPPRISEAEQTKQLIDEMDKLEMSKFRRENPDLERQNKIVLQDARLTHDGKKQKNEHEFKSGDREDRQEHDLTRDKGRFEHEDKNKELDRQLQRDLASMRTKARLQAAGAKVNQQGRILMKSNPEAFHTEYLARDIDKLVQEEGGWGQVSGMITGRIPNKLTGAKQQAIRQGMQEMIISYRHSMFGASMTPEEKASAEKAIKEIEQGNLSSEVVTTFNMLRNRNKQMFNQSMALQPPEIIAQVREAFENPDQYDVFSGHLGQPGGQPAPGPAKKDEPKGHGKVVKETKSFIRYEDGWIEEKK